ncbi:unnamed protein product [Nesidiocoris tenuis]|uniref:Reverse transcriptase domain-containing protein n=1 Tax=Nesidiocoris tenuis TaxID=355587 RepID=A0A6H5HK67_9HEMI|nr:unnamed protein product [Nesidiocoris tenuis]
MNVDISNNASRMCVDYEEVLCAQGFECCHREITRKRSNTCLDHVYLKSNSIKIEVLVDDNDITDHAGLLVKLEIEPHCREKPEGTPYLDLSTFKSEIAQTKWEEVYEKQGVDEALDIFYRLYGEAKDRSLKTLKLNSKTRRRQPWITQNLVQLVNRKNKLFKNLKNRRTNNAGDSEGIQRLEREYKELSLRVTHETKNRKIEYYKNDIETSSSDPKKFWKTVNRLIKQKASKEIGTLTRNGIDVTCNKQKAEIFNQHFADIPATLKRGMPSEGHSEMGVGIVPWIPEKLAIDGITPQLVQEILEGLDGSKSSGIDNISAKELKCVAEDVSAVLAYLFTLSIKSGTFPEAFKKAFIVPIHKSGSRAVVNNYRPISILPIISKVFERIVKDKFVAFFDHIDFFSARQYGFRRGLSTERALEDHINEIVEGLNLGRKVAAVYLDLTKAFDTVEHDLLLNKLVHSGVRDNLLKWFQSYLCGRSQVTRVNGEISPEMNTSQGLPQGTGLSPILFLLFVNDLCDMHLPMTSQFFFADDGSLVISARGPESTLESIAEQNLKLVGKWFRKNRLLLNLEKTKLVVYRYSSLNLSSRLEVKMHENDCPGSPCSCISIQEEKVAKYLGMWMDNHLTWEWHINKVRKNLNQFNFALRYLLPITGVETRSKIFSALYIPRMTYGIVHFGGTFPSYLKPLHSTYKRSINLVLPGNEPTLNEKIERIGTLPLKTLYYLAGFLYVVKHYQNYKKRPPDRSGRRTRRAYHVELETKTWAHSHSQYQSACLLPLLYNQLLPKILPTSFDHTGFTYNNIKRKAKKYFKTNRNITLTLPN